MGKRWYTLYYIGKHDCQIIKPMHKYVGTICVLCCLFFNVAAKQEQKDKAISVLPVPAFGYSPETRTYLGAVSLFTLDFYKDSLTRTSNAKLELNYTWNKQIIAETEWTYFFREEKWLTKGRIHYSKFPDRYYGVGSNTSENNEYLYNSNRLIAEGHALKLVKSKLFTGFGLKYIDYSNINPAAPFLYPELQANSSLGFGFTFLKDTRANLLNPTQGIYYNLYAGYVVQKQQYAEWSLDIRKYITWHDKATFAARFYNEYNFNDPPFYDYAFLGGDKTVRGYYYGRYRDNNLSTIQTEIRSILKWRMGLAIFGGISNLYNQFRTFSVQDTKYNCGVGFRYLIDRKENINLRLDYAIGQDDNSGFYISFGEAF